MSPLTIVFFSIFVCILSFWIRLRKKRMSVFQRHGIPGPKPNFLTGNLIEFNRKRDKCIDEWMEKYGEVFGFYLGGKPYVVCYDKELAKLIEIKEYKSFMNRDVITPDGVVPHYLISESIACLKDEKWKTVRNILSPNFSPGKIKMTSTPIRNSIKIFLDIVKENNGKPIETYQIYKNLVIDIICKMAMGIEANVQIGETIKFVRSLNSILDTDTVDILAIVSIWFPEFEPIPMYLRRIVDRIKSAMNIVSANSVMNTCRKIIDSRLKSGLHQLDLLQLLIDAEEESNGVKRKLTTDCIIGNAALFFVAGFDSTASILAWCTFYLAKYPEIQEKVRQEISDNTESNKEIEYADIWNLKYLDQVISETLRLHTLSILTVSRICSENFQYKNITIPKNITALIPVRNLHKDPNHWKDPEKFDPERFSSKNAGNIDPSMYQPFGAGPSNYLSMRMAQTILKLTLANFIRRFKLELHGNSDGEEEYTFFIVRPKNGVNVKLTEIVS